MKKNNRRKFSKLLIGLLTIIISTTGFSNVGSAEEKNQMLTTLNKINHFILNKKMLKKQR